MSFRSFADPCCHLAHGPHPSAGGPLCLVHSSSCPGWDCRLSEQTGSERSLPCLRSHGTAPSDSKPLSPPLRSSGPTQGCGPEPFGVDVCPLRNDVPSAFSHRLGPPGTQGCPAGVSGGVQLKALRVISEVDHGDNRASGGRRGSTAEREGPGERADSISDSRPSPHNSRCLGV